MAYNISEISGNGALADPNAAVPDWIFTADLADPSVTTITGQFQATFLFGVSPSTFSVDQLSPIGFGSLAIVPNTGVFTFTIDRTAVIASGNDAVVRFEVTGSRNGNPADTDTNIVTLNILICVMIGTLIGTPGGLVPVEDLQVGDLVLTADGRAEPIRWIGSRRLTAPDLRRDPSLRPVRIAAGAYGRNRPMRDLSVSPQHRVLLSGWRAELFFGEESVLAPAKGLLDDRAVRIDWEVEEVEYFHLLFDRHEIILTEGLPTESFYPGPHSLSELDAPARDELLRLLPQLETEHATLDPAGPGLRPWEARLLAAGQFS